MRSHEIVRASARHHMTTAFRQIGQALGLKQGFITAARRAATSHVVDCICLNDEDMPYGVYVGQLRECEEWCQQNCPHDHEIEPLRDRGRLIGRRYRFARESDAALFKMLFV
ncbi:hypothetical protein MAE02_69150 [Microvirga aerophila]|uniref:Uncharacterized protein n=1 Tax=Microvirga aerophila TaxID=670291 RepID=A0A512C4T0_9HYPH|nr:hypothetical protein MAE02_69150 [Microvirga aerophila]